VKTSFAVNPPLQGNSVVAVFIYDDNGPNWNLAHLNSGSWMPFEGWPNDDVSIKLANELINSDVPKPKVGIYFGPLTTTTTTNCSFQKKKPRMTAAAKKELVSYAGSLRVAKHMYQTAKDREISIQQALDVSSTTTPLPDPEITMTTSTTSDHEFLLPAVKCDAELNVGDEVCVVRMNKNVRVRVLAIEDDGEVTLSESVLLPGEKVFHGGSWKLWETLRLVVVEAEQQAVLMSRQGAAEFVDYKNKILEAYQKAEGGDDGDDA
jgi:hypothetical protein